MATGREGRGNKGKRNAYLYSFQKVSCNERLDIHLLKQDKRKKVPKIKTPKFVGVCHLFQWEHDRAIRYKSVDVHHLNSHYPLRVLESVHHVSFMDSLQESHMVKAELPSRHTTIIKHLCISKRQHRKSRAYSIRIPSQICSLLYAGSRRVSPEAVIFKCLLRRADLA